MWGDGGKLVCSHHTRSEDVLWLHLVSKSSKRRRRKKRYLFRVKGNQSPSITSTSSLMLKACSDGNNRKTRPVSQSVSFFLSCGEIPMPYKMMMFLSPNAIWYGSTECRKTFVWFFFPNRTQRYWLLVAVGVSTAVLRPIKDIEGNDPKSD